MGRAPQCGHRFIGQCLWVKVEVVGESAYLGSLTTNSPRDWSAHVRALIARANRKSADLLWVCRAVNGMRLRTAVALWNSIVRPILEYGSELWAGEISSKLSAEAEAVQTTFLQAIAGVHKRGMGGAVDFLRAEMGAEQLVARWTKLKLGFWRRLAVANPKRAIVAMVTLRRAQIAAGNRRLGTNSILISSRTYLNNLGLQSFWIDPALCAQESKKNWQEIAYNAVERDEDTKRAVRISSLSSLEDYVLVKYWGSNDVGHSEFAGEIGRWGYRVPECFLDDRSLGQHINRLKLLCRCRALPLLDRIGRERAWPINMRCCMGCTRGEVGDIRHFFMSCDRYADIRTQLMDGILGIVTTQGFGGKLSNGDKASDFDCFSNHTKLQVILGTRIGRAYL